MLAWGGLVEDHAFAGVSGVGGDGGGVVVGEGVEGSEGGDDGVGCVAAWVAGDESLEVFGDVDVLA